MANYNIVVDTSNFRPYDYSLAYRAIQDYNRGYEQSQAVYDKIAQTLGDLKSAVEGSTRAKQIYDTYQDNFNVAADEFSRGMNINTARKLGELRKIYGTQIRQLEKANEARVKAAEYLRAQNKDNDYLHEDIGSLDTWMDDPTRQVRGYSGNRLTTEVAAMMGSVAKSMKQLDADGRLDSYNKKWIETGGFSPERISEAISQLQTGGIESVKDDIIRGVLKNVAASSGMDNWADANTLQRRNEYMARGLYGGIGETKVGHFADEEAKKALEFKYKEMEAENAQKRALDLLKAKNQSDLDAAVGGIVPRSYLDETDTNGRTRYQSIQTDMQSLLDAQGNLKQEYTNGHKIDPLFIYDEYNKWADEHKKAVESYDDYDPGISTNRASRTIVPDYEGAKKYIRDKYGVTSILSASQYNSLKRLGYTDKSHSSWSALKGNTNLGEDYLQRLNNLATRNTVAYLNGSNINQAISQMLRDGLSATMSNTMVHKVKDDLSTGKAIDWNKVAELLGDKDENVRTTGVDLGKEKIIQVLQDGTKLEIDPSAFGDIFKRDWNKMLNEGVDVGGSHIPGKRQIEQSNLSDSQKAQAIYALEEAMALNLGQIAGRGYFQTLPQTKQD